MPIHNNLGSFRTAKSKETPQIIWNYSKAVENFFELNEYQIYYKPLEQVPQFFRLTKSCFARKQTYRNSPRSNRSVFNSMFTIF